MAKRKTIKICGQIFKIVYKTKLTNRKGEALLGECDVNKLTIYLLKGLTPEKETQILVHEAAHAIDKMLDLGLNEHKVVLLSLHIISLIRDNKLKL